MTDYGNEKTYALFDIPNNKKLIENLEAKQSKIIKVPVIQTIRTNFDEPVRRILTDPGRFDWIVFTDVLTVDYYLQLLEENEIDLFELDEVRICAFGEAVSDRLRFVQIHTDVLPIRLETSVITEEIRSYINSETELHGQCILILQAGNLPGLLNKQLIEANAAVELIGVYHFESSSRDTFSKLRALIAGGAIDNFIFSVPEDIVQLKFLLDDIHFNTNLFEQFIVTNETMYKSITELGIKPRYFSN